jgi:hypothetical protein
MKTKMDMKSNIMAALELWHNLGLMQELIVYPEHPYFAQMKLK